MTAIAPPPSDERPARTEADEKLPEPTKLSVTQIVASALAAVSTTVMLSFFGIAGTIIGAGAASVLTVVANFLYTRSIEKTHAQLKPVVGQMVRPRPGARVMPDGGTPAAQAAPGTATVTAVGADAGAVEDETDGSSDALEAPARPRNAWLRMIDRHGTFRVLAASTAVVFVVVMGVVLVAELFLGKPLAAAVQGVDGSGTSLSRTVERDSADVVGSGNRIVEDGGAGTTTGTDGSSTGTEDEESVEPTDESSTGTDGGTGTTPEPSPEPTTPVEPTEPAEPTDPAGPTEPTEPTAPATPEEGTSSSGTSSGTGSDDTGSSD